jgi:hypothetical protein
MRLRFECSLPACSSSRQQQWPGQPVLECATQHDQNQKPVMATVCTISDMPDSRLLNQHSRSSSFTVQLPALLLLI